MPNYNYINGRNKEYRIINKLREEGYTIVQRTAGSHSCVDILAIHIPLKIIKLVQSKPKNFSNTEKDRILSELKDLNGTFEVKFEIR